MMKGSSVRRIANGDCLELLRSGPFDMMAALSFEERSTSWAALLRRSGLRPERLLLFDYHTNVSPVDEGRRLRKCSRRYFEEVLGASEAPLCIGPINPFAMSSLVRTMLSLLDPMAGRTLLIDYSCMTRVHLMAAVNVLVSGLGLGSVIFCYSTPRSYGQERGLRLGWKDVLFLPIGTPRLFRREGNSHGIIIAGHYGERLSVALQELEPSSGVIIYSHATSRPDFLSLAREANVVSTSRLLSLRPPTSGSPRLVGDGWREHVVPMDDTERLWEIIRPELEASKADDGPVVVYPYGPKPLSLSLAVQLACQSDLEAWAVYPVPSGFSTAYSSGADELVAHQVDLSTT